MPKVNILVAPHDRAGVSKFRIIDPHVYLDTHFKDDFFVDINYNVNWKDLDYLKKFQIIFFHRTLVDYDQMPSLSRFLREQGIVSVMDIDDYWIPDRTHPAYNLVKSKKLDELIPANLKLVDYVTTTTPFFAEQIAKYNKNVVVFPNAIDPQEKQFISRPEHNELTRIGFLGGSSHQADLELMGGAVNMLRNDQEVAGKFQMVLCGYDLRGKVNYIDPKTGQTKERPLKPTESVWFIYENIFTDRFSLVENEAYKKYLLDFKKDPFKGEENQLYRRIWTRPVTSYATGYNLLDVSLAPLTQNMFNRCKSNLKMVEAGFMKKALICSEIEPYTLDGESGKNCLLVKPNRDGRDWSKMIKRLIKNPGLREDLGEALYETVSGKYTMHKVVTDRAQFYKSIIK